jgi:hypothetical protein
MRCGCTTAGWPMGLPAWSQQPLPYRPHGHPTPGKRPTYACVGIHSDVCHRAGRGEAPQRPLAGDPHSSTPAPAPSSPPSSPGLAAQPCNIVQRPSEAGGGAAGGRFGVSPDVAPNVVELAWEGPTDNTGVSS